MSLKAFHLVFIVASTLLSAGVGAWALREYTDLGELSMLAFSIGSFAATIGLCVYFAWVLKKLKNYSYLLIPVLIAELIPKSAWAFAVCMGNPDSPLVKSANTGVVFLLGVIGMVLVSFAGLFLFWARRAFLLDQAQLQARG